MEPFILTYTGREFWPLDPQPEMIDIEDIAHALSNICRFTGHCSRFYSVAEHSLLTSLNVDKDMALWALLHDASEAYLADLAKPIKAMFPNFVEAEGKIMRAVCQRFSLPLEEPDEVKIVDTRMLVTEARDLMAANWNHLGKPYEFSIGSDALPSSSAKNAFLTQFQLLYGREK